LITIEITNPEAIVNQHRGWFTGLAGTVAARLGMIDLAEKVQKTTVQRLKVQKTTVQRLIEELGAENVRISVSGPSEEVGAGK